MIQTRSFYLLLLLSAALVGCTPSEELPPERKSMVIYIRSVMSDPGSYEPVKWIQLPYQRKHVEIRDGVQLMMQVRGEEESLKRDYERNEITKKEDNALFKREYRRRMQSNDSLRTVAESLLASNDTSRLGTVLYHIYRLETRTGKIVTDTAGVIILAGNPGYQYPVLTYDIIENIRLH